MNDEVMQQITIIPQSRNREDSAGSTSESGEVSNARAKLGASRLRLIHNGQLIHGHGTLTDALAQIMQAGTTDTATLGDFDLGNPGGMQRENTLNTFAVGNFANGEGGVHADALAGDDDACENLDTLLVTFHDAGVDFDAVSGAEFGEVRLKLLLVDLFDDAHFDDASEVLLRFWRVSRGRGIWRIFSGTQDFSSRKVNHSTD